MLPETFTGKLKITLANFINTELALLGQDPVDWLAYQQVDANLLEKHGAIDFTIDEMISFANFGYRFIIQLQLVGEDRNTLLEQEGSWIEYLTTRIFKKLSKTGTPMTVNGETIPNVFIKCRPSRAFTNRLINQDNIEQTTIQITLEWQNNGVGLPSNYDFT